MGYQFRWHAEDEQVSLEMTTPSGTSVTTMFDVYAWYDFIQHMNDAGMNFTEVVNNEPNRGS